MRLTTIALTERVLGKELARLAPARLEQVRFAVQEVAEGGDARPRYPTMLQRLRACKPRPRQPSSASAGGRWFGSAKRSSTTTCRRLSWACAGATLR